MRVRKPPQRKTVDAAAAIGDVHRIHGRRADTDRSGSDHPSAFPDRGGEPHNAAPGGSKPEPDGGNEIDHCKENRRDLPSDRVGVEAGVRLGTDAEDLGPMVEALEHRDPGHDPQENH